MVDLRPNDARARMDAQAAEVGKQPGSTDPKTNLAKGNIGEGNLGQGYIGQGTLGQAGNIAQGFNRGAAAGETAVEPDDADVNVGNQGANMGTMGSKIIDTAMGRREMNK